MEAKNKCYPENVVINEEPVRSHGYSNYTRKKETITAVVENLLPDEKLSCTLVCKCEFD